jgi:site-specific recombinase XerD
VRRCGTFAKHGSAPAGHDLRHTFASLVASSGQSLLVVGELLGHSSPQTTKRYANLYDDSLRSAAEGIVGAIGVTLRPSETAEERH